MIQSLPPESFGALRAEWRALYARTGRRNLFSTDLWLDRWLASFGATHRVLVLRDREGLAAATVLRIVGSRAHHLEDHTYWPEILARSNAPRARQRLLADLGDVVEQVVLLAGDTESDLASLERDAEGRYDVVPRWTFPMHAVDTSTSFEAYLDTRRGKVRSELKRKNRRFSKELGDDELVALGPGDAASAVEAIREIERASWKDQTDTAIVSSEAELRFYEAVLALDEGGAEARTYLLLGEGRPRAFVLGVVYGDCYHALKTSYCADDARLAPGQVLFHRVIERLCADPAIARLELLGRDARWKQELATDTQMMRTYSLERRCLRSTITRFANQHVLPRLRTAIDNQPSVGRAVSRAREGLAAARRVLTGDHRQGRT